ncbi:MAG: hypothetical protein ACRETY_06300 [Steroidobacteraceae bacterium]
MHCATLKTPHSMTNTNSSASGRALVVSLLIGLVLVILIVGGRGVT